MPEEHTLLIVVQMTDFYSPPRSAACRAGACPTPADSTFPIITSSTAFGSIDLDANAALMAIPPNSGAVSEESEPIYVPMGVLLAATI